MSRHRIAWLASLTLAALVATLGGCKRKTPAPPAATNVMVAAKVAANGPSPHARVAAQQPAHPPAQVQQHERDTFRAGVQKDLDGVNAKVADLRARANKTTGAKRAEAEKLLRDVSSRKSTVQGDLASLPRATTATWASTKAKTQQDLAQLKGAVHVAAAKIPPMPKPAAAARR